MKRSVMVTAVVFALLVSVSLLASDAPKAMGVGQTRNITFVNPAKVGDAVLPAGDYKVEHVMEGENHIMVFKTLNNEAKARVNCKMIELQKKADQSTQEFVNEGGQRTLKGLTFKGDTYRHQF